MCFHNFLIYTFLSTVELKISLLPVFLWFNSLFQQVSQLVYYIKRCDGQHGSVVAVVMDLVCDISDYIRV